MNIDIIENSVLLDLKISNLLFLCCYENWKYRILINISFWIIFMILTTVKWKSTLMLSMQRQCIKLKNICNFDILVEHGNWKFKIWSQCIINNFEISNLKNGLKLSEPNSVLPSHDFNVAFQIDKFHIWFWWDIWKIQKCVRPHAYFNTGQTCMQENYMSYLCLSNVHLKSNTQRRHDRNAELLFRSCTNKVAPKHYSSKSNILSRGKCKTLIMAKIYSKSVASGNNYNLFLKAKAAVRNMVW